MTFTEWWQTRWPKLERTTISLNDCMSAWDAATLAERERCAKLAEGFVGPPHVDGYGHEIAAAIRSGEPPERAE